MAYQRLVRSVSLAVVVGCLGYGLGGYPLIEPDEGRNAEVAREMAETNDYVLPTLNGLPYLDKPILFFAAGALVMELAGPSEIAARLPALVFTLLTLLVVAWLGRRLFGAEGAWIAALVCGASPFTIAYARTVIFDSAVTLWIVVALAAFYAATERPDDDRTWRWSVLAWIAIGLGVLTKGPVALAIPLMVAIPYAVWRRAWKAVLDPVGMLAFVAVVLPWVLLVSRRIPDFLHYVLVVETVERLTTDALGRTGPIWYFFPILLGAALPWTVVVLACIDRRTIKPAAWDRRSVFLVLWIAAPLLFFTLSQSKRPQYILPLIPAVGLLTAQLWTAPRCRARGARAGGITLLVLGLGIAATRHWIVGLFETTEAVAAVIPSTALLLGGFCILCGAVTVLLAHTRDLALLALAVPVIAIPIVAMPLMRAIAEDRSSAALAGTLARVAPSGAEVVAIGVYPLSLAFYLGRHLTLVTADGSELTSNYVARHDDVLRRIPGSTLRPPGWWAEALTFCERPRIFLTRRDAEEVRARLAERLPILAETRKFAAYGPCGVADLARSED
ncbi:MAG: glycosyltransferase family 39 protein [Gemmatimonadetes bacterium]|nr:glycosyltransferase family 39 protein [Gemmatimonadota bacterium]